MNGTTNESAPLIVCAVSGSDSSRYAQERAIALAKERGGRVAFVNVLERRLIDRVDPRLADTVRDELRHMRAALLNIAVERAAVQHVPAEMSVLDGDVDAGLERFVREHGAAARVIGAAGPELDDSAFDAASQERFARHLRQTAGVEVVIVGEPGR